ncbi:MAG TPA: M1 family metallopeptidase [Ohtaekwangia sp.]|uniref:M1 family metallopeptidase n=1 Tax=Ohtaekwangia sp. TaxID=2066019 RepID=UPI002F9572DC
MKFYILIIPALLLSIFASAQDQKKWQGKFEQLDQLLPTPNQYRTGSGEPGAKYWQQRADYTIDAEIDEPTNTLKGKETITYYNNSPETLKYLWLQLDQNINKKGNEDFGNYFGPVRDSLPTLYMQYITRAVEFEGGYSIQSVTDKASKNLPITINNTMMRIDLPVAVKPGESYTFNVAWTYPITDRSLFLLSREGYEHFPEDNNNVYLIAHWFPRMCQFDDYEGWQNKQFQRLGEFALEFGTYKVNITVPADHLVASTGALLNAKDVLSAKELERFEKAKSSFDKPTIIVTEEEARAKEKTKSTAKKTWKFQADNVRDVAFASSRKFIWDVQAVKLPTNTVLAMSFYPKEGLPVWSEESTKAVKNAVEIYSKYTFDYPYPVAISVNTSNIGMEFPMISFNGGRPRNGQMSDNAKAGMIGTIVHEVGHNYFPMIVSSDERQWMWMDEGLNTFLQTRTEMERYPAFHHTTPKDIVPYMKGDKSVMRPVMNTSDNERLNAFGSNYYAKPTVALTILRETIIGKDLFDKAFKEYANRWMYKHPRPADFFRMMEEATAVDLDWFWRGWFFTTDNVDISVEDVKWYKLNTAQANVENKNKTAKAGDLSAKATDKPNSDFSQGPQPFTVLNTEDKAYGEFRSRIDDNAVRQKLDGKNIYQVKFKNNGGLVMPLLIEWTYKDGSKEVENIPAEIWRTNENEVNKVFVKEKEVVNIALDPNSDLADVDVSNNVFPKKPAESKFDQFKKTN